MAWEVAQEAAWARWPRGGRQCGRWHRRQHRRRLPRDGTDEMVQGGRQPRGETRWEVAQQDGMSETAQARSRWHGAGDGGGRGEGKSLTFEL